MKRLLLILLFVTSMFHVESASSKKMLAERNGLSLLVGKPVSEKFIRQLDNPPGSVMIGAWYGVNLNSVRVVDGDLKAGKKIYLELRATDSGVISRYKEIFVLVEKGEDGILRGKWWGSPTYAACVPENVIEGTPIANQFSKTDGSSKSTCASLYPKP